MIIQQHTCVELNAEPEFVLFFLSEEEFEDGQLRAQTFANVEPERVRERLVNYLAELDKMIAEGETDEPAAEQR